MGKVLKRNTGLLVYVLVWGMLVCWFWLRKETDGMGYGLLTFYLILPVSAFLVSLGYGRRECGWKWLLILFFGGMEVLAGGATFDLANTLSAGRWNTPAWDMAWLSMVSSMLGLGISSGVRFFHRKSKGGGR